MIVCDPWSVLQCLVVQSFEMDLLRWNPAVEQQAIQRAHRIGQTRPVTAIRMITTGTIEERMLELQDKKQLVFDGRSNYCMMPEN